MAPAGAAAARLHRRLPAAHAGLCQPDLVEPARRRRPGTWPDARGTGSTTISSWSQDDALWGALWRTLLIVVVAVPAQFLLGLGLAALFVDRFPGKTLFYTILLTPMMVVPAVVGYMFFLMFQQSGPINQLIGAGAGRSRRDQLAERRQPGHGRGDDRRDLGVDAAHVPHPAAGSQRRAGGPDARRAPARRQRLAALLAHRPAEDAHGHRHRAGAALRSNASRCSTRSSS